MRSDVFCGSAVTMVLGLALGGSLSAATLPSERFEPLRVLLKDAKYADAERAGRALIAEVAAASGDSSVDAAMVCDLLSEAIWRQTKPRDPEARALAERAVRLKQRILGREHLELAVSLNNLGNLLHATGEVAAARQVQERSLAIREKALGPDDLLVAASLSNLAIVLNAAGDSRGAAPRFQRALAIREKALGPDHPLVVSSLSNIALIHFNDGKYAEARPLYERGAASQEKSLGPDHPDLARTLGNLAATQMSLGDLTAARPTYQRTLAIYEKALGPDHPDVARTLQNFAVLVEDMGDYATARSMQERALGIREKALGPDHQDVAWSLNGLAAVLWASGDLGGARPRFERALAIWEKALGPDHPMVAGSLTNIANLLQVSGDYAAARPRYDRALAIYEKGAGPDHPGVADILNNYAALLLEAGDFAAARPMLDRALGIYEKAYGREHLRVANALSSLGRMLGSTRDYAAARTQFDRALAINEKTFGPEHPAVAGNLISIAELLHAAGSDSAARPLYERALAIREKSYGPDHPETAVALRGLARLLHSGGDYAAARPLYERAVSVVEKSLGPNHPDMAATLASLAALNAAQGDTAKALDRALAAERVSRDHLELTGRSLSEREALRYAAVRTSGLDLALALAVRVADPASGRRVLDALVRSRAVVLDEMAARHRAVGRIENPRVERLAADLATARGRMATLLVRGRGDMKPETFRGLLEDAGREKERAERDLAAASVTFAGDLSIRHAGVDEVSANLPPGSALVSFAQHGQVELVEQGKARMAPARYLAFVLRAGDRDPRVVDLGPAAYLDGLVAIWRKAASSPTGDEAAYREIGERLRRHVWDPLVPALHGVKRALIVPDGPLNLVNLAALPREGGGYLVEREPIIHYLSAERDLVPRRETRPGDGLLAVGMPNYDTASLFASTRDPAAAGGGAAGLVAAGGTFRGQQTACSDFASVQFKPLPGTGKESQEIVGLWRKHAGRGSGTAATPLDLSDAAASETAFKLSAPGRRVLHLATHGFFLGGECASALDATRGIGGLSASPIGQPDAPPPAVSGENPLRLSGLVFAGANRRASAAEGEDDGILTAEEIASLDLSGVEWAVLSACETGVGDIRAGEGVFGLRRAFQVAGAGTLIMSLWEVDDEATLAWMRSLYMARLKDHLDTTTAMRRSSLEVLRARRARKLSTHPFYWAAFVAAGNWR